MAYRIQLIVVSMLAGAGLAACGLGVVGVEPLGAASDAGSDAGARPATPDCSRQDCLALVASGFTPIGFGAASEVCPSGFDSTDGFGDPQSKDGSCACGACTTTGSTCTTGDVPSSQSNDETCSNYGSPFHGNAGKCTSAYGYWGSNYGGVNAPKPVLGTCHADGQVVREKIDVTVDRVCTPRAGTCAAALCSLGGGLEVCLTAPGDVACPSVAPVKKVIGDLQASCTACSCTPAATCGGKLHWWETSSSCNGAEAGTVPAAVCTQVGGKDIRSYLWEGAVTSESCASTVPPAKATVARNALRTVCCPG